MILTKTLINRLKTHPEEIQDFFEKLKFAKLLLNSNFNLLINLIEQKILEQLLLNENHIVLKESEIYFFNNEIEEICREFNDVGISANYYYNTKFLGICF